MQLLTAVYFTYNSHALEKFAWRTRYPRDTDFAERGRVPLFAEDSYLNLLFSVSNLVVRVDVDHEFVELVDQVFQVIGLDLVDVEGDALLAQRLVHVLAGLGRNESSEADPGTQQVHGHTDVYLDGPLMRIAAAVGIDQNPQVLVPGGRRRPSGSG